MIANSPTALQLRYLQTLSIIAAEKSSSIFFPIPIDILSGMVSIKQLYGIIIPLSFAGHGCCRWNWAGRYVRHLTFHTVEVVVFLFCSFLCTASIPIASPDTLLYWICFRFKIYSFGCTL